MNRIKYFIVESNVQSGIDSITTYGIAATISSDEIIACISDITCDKIKLEYLVDLCNREKLSPIHLNDVVEDFLYS